MEERDDVLQADAISGGKEANMGISADLIRGHIIESGNHEQLLAKGGRYADLYHEIVKLE